MKTQNAEQIFQDVLEKLYQAHLPSKHPFFTRLSLLPLEQLRSPDLLGEIYLRYQAACHATRVMIYFIPYLNSPGLRERKLKIISDDDSWQNGGIHHYQLSRAFANLGAKLIIPDEEFGSLDELQKCLDPTTANFVSLVQKIYPQSLGPFCVVEMFAHDWMQALMNSLAHCFPFIRQEPYFAECFDQGIEERHAQEALELTSIILNKSPQLLAPTLEGANMMAMALDKFWSGLDNLLQDTHHPRI
ncbi:hypothetical protein NIES21_58510 (plasmid) [Anabaenopsis circularis NIES-21]|uniref:Thiaminase-2/PQQC domain-containing protein n=1 Tax=Anabaenopsis circularis NIES-21 TaxID=1085406 RepID=A0A1Z4GR37_9CYAN|nr:hypothetical protein NIES21_58510 [Anabaenopsis circularis NIES-21]